MKRRCTPVEESYLLQQQLAQAETDSDYRTGESVYRQWVYDHYLTVPQDTYDALTAQFHPRSGLEHHSGQDGDQPLSGGQPDPPGGDGHPGTRRRGGVALTGADRGTVSTMPR